jgi:hypothetical protein
MVMMWKLWYMHVILLLNGARSSGLMLLWISFVTVDNEINEPSFTQPKMYKVIRNHPRALDLYENQLIEMGQLSKEEIDALHNKVSSILNEGFINTRRSRFWHSVVCRDSDVSRRA